MGVSVNPSDRRLIADPAVAHGRQLAQIEESVAEMVVAGLRNATGQQDVQIISTTLADGSATSYDVDYAIQFESEEEADDAVSVVTDISDTTSPAFKAFASGANSATPFEVGAVTLKVVPKTEKRFPAANGVTFIRGGEICAAAKKEGTPKTYLCNCPSETSCAAGSISSGLQEVWLASRPRIILHWQAGRTAMYSLMPSNNLPRTDVFTANITSFDGGSFAYISDGALFGESEAGAFLGTASYLAMAGTLRYNHNKFVVSSRSGEKSSATVCISPPEESNATSFQGCGAELTSQPGTFKWSVYGNTFGESITASMQQLVSVGATHLVYRTKLCYVQQADWKINSRPRGEGVLDNETQVETVDFTQIGNKPLSIKFPQQYVFGNVSSCVKAKDQAAEHLEWYCQPSGVKQVRITAASFQGIGGPADVAVSCNDEHYDGGFFLDYAFELEDLVQEGSFWAYDPEVSTSPLSAARDEVADVAPVANPMSRIIVIIVLSAVVVLALLLLIFMVVRSKLKPKPQVAQELVEVSVDGEAKQAKVVTEARDPIVAIPAVEEPEQEEAQLPGQKGATQLEQEASKQKELEMAAQAEWEDLHVEAEANLDGPPSNVAHSQQVEFPPLRFVADDPEADRPPQPDPETNLDSPEAGRPPRAQDDPEAESDVESEEDDIPIAPQPSHRDPTSSSVEVNGQTWRLSVGENGHPHLDMEDDIVDLGDL